MAPTLGHHGASWSLPLSGSELSPGTCLVFRERRLALGLPCLQGTHPDSRGRAWGLSPLPDDFLALLPHMCLLLEWD